MAERNFMQVLLSQSGGACPQMQGALRRWCQPMTFVKIEKTVENFKNVETSLNIDFKGVWQPFGPRQLSMRPEGQRSWKWFQLHSFTQLSLETDDIVEYKGTRYRVMEQNDFTEYGYFQYNVVQDFTGSGP